MSKKIIIVFQYLLLGLLVSSCQTSILEKRDNYEAIEKAFKWQKDQHSYHTSEAWINASYYMGLNRAHALTLDDRYLNALIKRGQEEEWYTKLQNDSSADYSLCASYLYLDKIGISEVSLLPTAHIINNRFCHKTDGNTGAIPNMPIWNSTDLYIAAPLMMTYAKKVNDSYFVDQMHDAYTIAYNHLYSEEHQLFQRSPKSSNQSTKANDFLLQENAMILTGLALILEKMPKGYIYRSFYEGLFRTMANRLKQLQHKSGLWSENILSTATGHENISGSILCTFAFAWGINNHQLKANDYLLPTQKAWKKIRQYQKLDGKVDGENPKNKHIQEATSTFILAGSEIIKMNENMHLAKH